MQIKNGLFYLNTLGDFNLFWLFLFENFILILLSVGVGLLLDYKNTIFNRKDTKWIASTLFCNTFVTFIGFKLFILNYIHLSFHFELLNFITDLFLITIIMDFLMFVFHFYIHKIKEFNNIHKHHHLHIETSVYSLYVLHPIETLGFGFLWLMTIMVIDYNFYSLAFYLILNLTYGILGHLKADVFPSFWTTHWATKWISTTGFHNNHHKNEAKNFGFYFTFWDKIFKTYL
jgi:sterol desaturase/sphingolipid hydroxylase (fatty acid hydroxylase superfamily)